MMKTVDDPFCGGWIRRAEQSFPRKHELIPTKRKEG